MVWRAVFPLTSGRGLAVKAVTLPSQSSAILVKLRALPSKPHLYLPSPAHPFSVSLLLFHVFHYNLVAHGRIAPFDDLAPLDFFSDDSTIRSKSEDAFFLLYKDLVTSYGEIVSGSGPGNRHCR